MNDQHPRIRNTLPARVAHRAAPLRLAETFACAAGTTRQAKQIAARNRNTPFIPRPARSNLRIQAPAPSGIPGYWR